MTAQPPPYLSHEWAENAIRSVRDDPNVIEAMAGHKVSVLIVIENGPPGRVTCLYAGFDGKGGSDLRAGTDKDALLQEVDKPTFTIRGDYETYAAIRDGKMTEKHAFIHRLLHVSGHKFKALMLAHPMQALTHALAHVPAVT